MATTQLPAVSTEYIHVPVTASVVLDTQTVELAFVTGTAPTTTTDWYPAAWTGTAGSTRIARLLIGPEGDAQPTGTVNVYVRVTDTPEIPVRNAGQLKVI